MKKLMLFVQLFLHIGFAQFYYNGDIHPSVMLRHSNNDIIDLPYRLVDGHLSYSLRSIDIKSSFTLEHRIESQEYSVELRELYAIWYPSFGEITLGKQIHAWGAVDGNNPTDNINPYDFYFMFLPGTDRKRGILTAAANIYAGGWQIETIVIPDHTGNRIPYNEPDFPIIEFDEPSEDQIETIENPVEIGIRLKSMVGENDFSLSYFTAHDRSLTPSEMTVTPSGPQVAKFGYRKTSMIGFDWVGFIGDVTYRIESSVFQTKDEDWQFQTDAVYSQSVLQLEMTGFWDIVFSGQYIGSAVHDVKGGMSSEVPPVTIDLDKSSFQPGMGTPFAIFTDRGFMGSAKGTLLDNTLELTATVFYDMDGNGKLLGFDGEYSPIENWILSLGNTSIVSDNDDSTNPFNKLEDFSHYTIGVQYNF